MILRKRKAEKCEKIEEIVSQLVGKTNVLVFTGAGLSSSSGLWRFD
jgi:NAD-dependent SIR2 family protein deacetylase